MMQATQQRRYSEGPLGAVRVLELADRRGQWCGKLLGHMGADVIKVEPPGGAAERNIGPFYQDEPHPERSLYFWHYNASKRGITLNLESEDGRDILRRLAGTADVVLESYRPGYLPSLGLGYDQLREVNPKLIMCSLTDFGQTGPWRDYHGSDLIHLALGGQMESCGYDEDDVPNAPPMAPGGGNAWHMGSHYAYIALTAALFQRSRTGKGQYIDCSVHSACALTTEMKINIWIYTKQHLIRQTARHSGVTPSGKSQHPTGDGKYVAGGAGGARMTPARLRELAEWLDSFGLADDLLDPKYQDPEVIRANQRHIAETVRKFAASVPQEAAYHGGQRLGLTWGAVRAPEEIVQDPHWYDRGFWQEVEHPELGKTFTYPGAAAIYSDSPPRISRRAPLIGEHNDEVFSEIGLSTQELPVLREAGVI